MGNKQALPANISSLKPGSWVQAGEDQQNALFSNVNPYRRRLLANIMTHQLIEQYELNFITEQDYNSYISQLSYRQVKESIEENSNYQSGKDHQQSFVYPIRYFVNKSRNEMCTTIHTGYLYADKVDLRLKEINDIPFDDLLYVYFATLNGFKLLYQKVGYFDIVEEMIFITRKGQVKVWMNANLAKNYPNYDKNSPNNNSQTYSKNQHENIHGSQADMIRRLILLIEKNSDEYEQMGEPQNQLFSEYLQSKNIFDKLSFQHSIQELHSYFLQNNLHCPRRMKSIPELFAPDQNHEQPTNYQVSHVNEITTQHLTQLKKTFQPMQTIPQDDKYPSFSNNNKDYHNDNYNQQRSYSKLHQSQVNSYQSPSLHQNLKSHRNINFESQFTKVVRPKQHQQTDLGQSRYSQQTQNNKCYDNQHLKKSTRSTTSVQPQIIQKPNSVTSFHYLNQNQVSRGIPVYHHSPYQSQARIVPSNFTVQAPPFIHNISPQQQIIHHQNFPIHHFPTQPIMQPSNHQVQHQIFLPQQIHYQNVLPQQMHYQNVTQRQPQFLPPPSFFPSNIENNQMNRVKIQSFSNQTQPQQNYVTQNMNSAGLKGQDLHSTSAVRNVQSVQQYSEVRIFQPTSCQDGSKSNIKYFTKQESYHIDEQIANDLQKFLGLKVN